MHAVAFGALRVAQKTSLRTCRIVAGSRLPSARRNFHRSTILRQVPEEPSPPGAGAEDATPEQGIDQVKAAEEIGDGSNVQAEGESSTARKAKHGKSAFGGRTKVIRRKQPDGIPPLVIPEWFLTKNVKCIGDADPTGSLTIVEEADEAIYSENDQQAEKAMENNNTILEADPSPTTNSRYSIHTHVYKEILATLKAGLALRPPRKTNKTILRPHTLLQCPKDGSTFYLDSIVEAMARELGADLVRMDAQDMAQILGPYVDENIAWTDSSTSFLGYDAHKMAGKLEDYDKDNSTQDYVEGIEDEDSGLDFSKTGKSSPLAVFSSAFTKNLSSILASKKKNSPSTSQYTSSHTTPIIGYDFTRGTAPQAAQPTQKSKEEQWIDLKVTTAFDTLIFAADSKRLAASADIELDSAPKDVIIQLKDYKDLCETNDGPELLRSLQAAINRRWLEGRNIILLGTTSTDDCGLTKPQIQQLQSDIITGDTRTIFVPPYRTEAQDVAFETDEKARIRQINIRHIEDMITRLTEGAEITPKIDIEKNLDGATAFSAGLQDVVWSFPHVHRIATTILGLDMSSSVFDGLAFTKAWNVLSRSDEAKFGWGAAELKLEDDDVNDMLKDMNNSNGKTTKERIKQIRKTCSSHEKRLLGGVIIPSDIHTTFDDVHAPKETIEALKTLTTLSLIRPDAFSYGVLATDKIPGLLLYGPPGTGKTLLAKAVAKESGATVLEVSGAEVNDMYVGEGEKNVKAIFTLAKKLSPCVVFIDEADAIFAQRSDTKRSGTHRELINQFLREWDGMTDLSAFIMVATNRPFDLDEAVLRRLPRRLLVDLPVEKDREAILKIHLKDEILDESVSLATLAKNTPYYSGSDLKNISVAAALACIREENEAAAKHIEVEPYVFPEKRILTKQHFDKAMDEISASISEDMSTLAAIRKFDEKYGDRRSRRKKGPGLGFGGTTVQEKDSEGGRVRKARA